MDPKRQGEIAFNLLKFIIKTKGVRVSFDLVAGYGNIGEHIGASKNEMKEFSSLIIREVIDELLK